MANNAVAIDGTETACISDPWKHTECAYDECCGWVSQFVISGDQAWVDADADPLTYIENLITYTQTTSVATISDDAYTTDYT